MNSCDKNLQAFINTLEETKSISSGWPEFFFVKFEAKDVIRWPFRKETGAFKSKAACKAQAEKTLKTIYNQAEQRFRQAKDEVLTNYLSHLTEHLGRLDGLLAQCRTAENETAAASIRDLLQAERIAETSSGSSREAEKTTCSLPCPHIWSKSSTPSTARRTLLRATRSASLSGCSAGTASTPWTRLTRSTRTAAPS